MKVTEADLDGLLVQAGWVGERARLPAGVIDAIAEKLRVAPGSERHQTLAMMLNHIFASSWAQFSYRLPIKAFVAGKNKRPRKLTTVVRDDLKMVSEAYEKFYLACHAVSNVTSDFFDEILRQHKSQEKGFTQLVKKIENSFGPIGYATYSYELQTARGREESHVRQCVYALAELYTEFTREWPKRTYSERHTREGSGRGEQGVFLEIVRKFFSAFPEEHLIGAKSLTGIVRHVIANPPPVTMADKPPRKRIKTP